MLLTALAVAAAAPALAASSSDKAPDKAPGMPPVTGTMYNGNNAHPPRFDTESDATPTGQRPNVVNQAVTGTGTGASQGHTSQAGGGN